MLYTYIILGFVTYGWINRYLKESAIMPESTRKSFALLVGSTGIFGFIATMVMGYYKKGWEF